MEPSVSLLHTSGDRSSTWQAGECRVAPEACRWREHLNLLPERMSSAAMSAPFCGLYRVHQVAKVERERRRDGNQAGHQGETSRCFGKSTEAGRRFAENEEVRLLLPGGEAASRKDAARSGGWRREPAPGVVGPIGEGRAPGSLVRLHLEPPTQRSSPYERRTDKRSGW